MKRIQQSARQVEPSRPSGTTHALYAPRRERKPHAPRLRKRNRGLALLAGWLVLSIGSACHHGTSAVGSAADGQGSPPTSNLWRVADPEAGRHLAAVLQESRARRDHTWAGQYVLSDRADTDRLALAPKAGFVLISGKAGSCCSGAAGGHACSPDCPGAKEALFGDVVEMRDGRIRLALALSPGNVILAGEYFPMKIGTQHYLIPSDDIIAFKQAVAEGKDAQSEAAGRYYVRQGDR